MKTNSEKFTLNEKYLGSSFEDFKKEVYSKEERQIFEAKVELISAMIQERKKHKITQKKLEMLTGVKQPMIAKIESGESNPSIESVLRLLNAMGKKLKIAAL